MKYEHIKYAKLSHTEIAKIFGYKNVHSFRSSSAHKAMMKGINECLGIVIERQAKESQLKV